MQLDEILYAGDLPVVENPAVGNGRFAVLTKNFADALSVNLLSLAWTCMASTTQCEVKYR